MTLPIVNGPNKPPSDVILLGGIVPQTYIISSTNYMNSYSGSVKIGKYLLPNPRVLVSAPIPPANSRLLDAAYQIFGPVTNWLERAAERLAVIEALEGSGPQPKLPNINPYNPPVAPTGPPPSGPPSTRLLDAAERLKIVEALEKPVLPEGPPTQGPTLKPPPPTQPGVPPKQVLPPPPTFDQFKNGNTRIFFDSFKGVVGGVAPPVLAFVLLRFQQNNEIVADAYNNGVITLPGVGGPNSPPPNQSSDLPLWNDLTDEQRDYLYKKYEDYVAEIRYQQALDAYNKWMKDNGWVFDPKLKKFVFDPKPITLPGVTPPNLPVAVSVLGGAGAPAPPPPPPPPLP